MDPWGLASPVRVLRGLVTTSPSLTSRWPRLVEPFIRLVVGVVAICSSRVGLTAVLLVVEVAGDVGTLVNGEEVVLVGGLLDDILPLLADLSVLDQRNALLNGVSEHVLVRGRGVHEGLLDDEVAKLVGDEGVEARRLAELGDDAGSHGRLGVLQAPLDHWRGVLLVAQLGDLRLELLVDGQASLVVPFRDDLADREVSVRILHQVHEVVHDDLGRALAVLAALYQHYDNLDDAEAVSVLAHLVEAAEDLVEDEGGVLFVEGGAREHLANHMGSLLVLNSPQRDTAQRETVSHDTTIKGHLQLRV